MQMFNKHFLSNYKNTANDICNIYLQNANTYEVFFDIYEFKMIIMRQKQRASY